MFQITGHKNSTERRNYYNALGANRSGWINCDRFYSYTGRIVNCKINLPQDEKTDVDIVFRNTKAIMPAVGEGKYYLATHVPDAEAITIVAIRFDGAQPMLAIKQTTTDKAASETLEFIPCAMKELKQRLKVLD